MRMTFVYERNSLIFVADLLNAYGESLEDVFERVFRMCIGGVNLQHFNPLRAADFPAHLSRATEEFSQNN